MGNVLPPVAEPIPVVEQTSLNNHGSLAAVTRDNNVYLSTQ